MKQKRKTGVYIGKTAACFLLILCLLGLAGCGEGTELTEAEQEAVQNALGADVSLTDMTAETLTEEVQETDPSVTKVYLEEEKGQYVFFASPVGYNGPIDFMLIIDGSTNQTMTMTILHHLETEEYVRDMESAWFTDRFTEKDAYVYLERCKLEAEKENQIVAITGSTVTTDAVVTGVNECFEVYRTMENGYYADDSAGTVQLLDEEGNELGLVTIEDMKGLDSYRRSLVIHSTQGDTSHDFRGARLSEVIALADPTLTERYDTVWAVGTDGYEAGISMEEVLLENNVYLMYEDQDKPILTAQGKEGGLRLIVLKDQYGQRFTNYLLKLRLMNEERE